jgi:uncharacterized protein (DUF849 family)
VVINLTTGGAQTMTVEERLQPALQFKPEVASLNMGSMNFGLFPMLDRYKEFKHEWEPQYLENTRDWCSATPSRTSSTSSFLNGQRHALRVRVLRHRAPLQPAHFVDRGLVKAPLFVQTCSACWAASARTPTTCRT